MAYMAQPSFLIAPDSSGHQFYSARPFTRNPLNEPTGPTALCCLTCSPAGDKLAMLLVPGFCSQGRRR